MEQLKKEKKIGFFKRLKLAIFNLEDYGIFLGEKFSKAFKFLLVLVLIFALAGSFAENYTLSNTVNKYIADEMPDFTYNDGVLKASEHVNAYDHDYHFRLLVNTDDNVTEETIKSYEKEVGLNDLSVLLLKDKAILLGYALKEDASVFSENINDKDLYELTMQEMSYKDMQGLYPGVAFKDKEEFANVVRNEIAPSVVTTAFLPVAAFRFVTDFVRMFGDVCVVAIIGYIAALFLGVRFKMVPMLSLSIYSMTLSFVLNGIYTVASIATGLYIEYFEVVYLVIGYIYVIAAVFMIKYDLIKQHEELQKVLEVQKEVKKEMEEAEAKKEAEENADDSENSQSEEEKAEEESKEEEKEPDGSEI